MQSNIKARKKGKVSSAKIQVKKLIFSEQQLLKGLSPYKAHASELAHYCSKDFNQYFTW